MKTYSVELFPIIIARADDGRREGGKRDGEGAEQGLNGVRDGTQIHVKKCIVFGCEECTHSSHVLVRGAVLTAEQLHYTPP